MSTDDDDSDSVMVEQSQFSKFSHSSQNVTSVKGKSPIIKQTKIKYTPLEQQFLDIKDKYPDALLLVECGYKYRMFGEDAEVCIILSFHFIQLQKFYGRIMVWRYCSCPLCSHRHLWTLFLRPDRP